MHHRQIYDNDSAGARAPFATEVLVDEDFPIGVAANFPGADDDEKLFKNEFLKLEIIWKNREYEFPDREKKRARAINSISLGVGAQEELPANFETFLGRTISNQQKKNAVKKQFCQFIQHYRDCNDEESDYLTIDNIVETVVLNERFFLTEHTE